MLIASLFEEVLTIVDEVRDWEYYTQVAKGLIEELKLIYLY